MSRLLNVRITGGTDTGPFDLYYDSISTSKYVTSDTTKLPATGITKTELTSGIGYLIRVPWSATSIIIESKVTPATDVFPLVVVASPTPAPTLSPTPTPLITATPAPTPTPTATINAGYYNCGAGCTYYANNPGGSCTYCPPYDGIRQSGTSGPPTHYTTNLLGLNECVCIGKTKYYKVQTVYNLTGLIGPTNGFIISCEGTCINIPTASPIPTSTFTPTPTSSSTPAPTASATPAPTASATPAPTASATPAPTASATPAPTATSTPQPTPTPTQQPWTGYWGLTISEACNAYASTNSTYLSTFYSTNTSTLCGGAPNNIYDWSSTLLTSEVTTNGLFYICNAGGVREFQVSGAPSNKDAVSQAACFPCPTPIPTATPAPTASATPAPTATPQPTPTPTQQPWTGYWGLTISEACNAYASLNSTYLSTFYSTNTSTLCGGAPNNIYDWSSTLLTSELTTDAFFYICNAGGVRQFQVSGAPSNKDAVSQGACFPCPTPIPTATPAPTASATPAPTATPQPTPTPSATPQPTPTPTQQPWTGYWSTVSEQDACTNYRTSSSTYLSTFYSTNTSTLCGGAPNNIYDWSSSTLTSEVTTNGFFWIANAGGVRQFQVSGAPSNKDAVSQNSCVICPTPTPTPSPTASRTPTPTPSKTPNPTPTPTADGAGYYDDGYGCVYFSAGNPGAGYTLCPQVTLLTVYNAGGSPTAYTTLNFSSGCYCFNSVKYQFHSIGFINTNNTSLEDVSGGSTIGCAGSCG